MAWTPRPGRRFAGRNPVGVAEFRNSARHGCLPALKGHRAQFTASQRRISLSWKYEQS